MPQCKKWTKREDSKLKVHYPDNITADIVDKFKGRTEAAIKQRASLIGVVKSAEFKSRVNVKLSQALVANWASGERKKSPIGTGGKISESLIKTNRIKKQKRLAEMPPYVLEFISLSTLNRTKQSLKNSGEKKIWVIKTPENVILEGNSLSELIKNNVHRFKWVDVLEVGDDQTAKCRAYKGIRSLLDICNKTGTVKSSWKNWMLRLRYETICKEI